MYNRHYDGTKKRHEQSVTVALKFRRKLKNRMCVLNIILTTLPSNATLLLFQPAFANFQIVFFDLIKYKPRFISNIPKMWFFISNGSGYTRMGLVKFAGEIWRDMICLDRPYHFKFFKGCYPQILLGPFLNTVTKIFYNAVCNKTMAFSVKRFNYNQYLFILCSNKWAENS